MGFAAAAHQGDAPITTASELRAWCGMGLHALFIGQGITTYKWSVSRWESAVRQGKLAGMATGGDHRTSRRITCRGGQTRDAAMSINGDEEE